MTLPTKMRHVFATPCNNLDDVGLLVHDDDGGGAEAGLGRHQGIKVHKDLVAHPGR